MSKDWTKEELDQVSKAMIKNGHMGYEELCELLGNGVLAVESSELENDSKEEQA